MLVVLGVQVCTCVCVCVFITIYSGTQIISCNINYNMNSSLQLHVGTHIIYIGRAFYIPKVEMKYRYIDNA